MAAPLFPDHGRADSIAPVPTDVVASDDRRTSTPAIRLRCGVLWIPLLAFTAQMQVHAPPGCDTVSLSAMEVPVGVAITATITLNRAYQGSIAIRAGERVYPARSVEADDCEEVAAALALIAELALDRMPKLAASQRDRTR